MARICHLGLAVFKWIINRNHYSFTKRVFCSELVSFFRCFRRVGEAGVKWRQNGRGERSVVLKLLDDEEELGRQMLLDEEERRRQLRGGGKTTRGPVLSGDQES